jgi:hypothetical protein
MPTIPSHSTLRGAALAVALLTTAVAAPASAFAAAAPTIGVPTVIAAGQRTPINVGGNHLLQGATLPQGTQLLRFAVTMNGVKAAPVTLSCPDGTVESGFGVPDPDTQIYAAAVAGSRFYEQTRVLTLGVAPKVDPATAHGQVYLLCRDPAVAPLPSGLSLPTQTSLKAGQRTPVAVPGAHLRRGARIGSGTQLIRWGVTLFVAKERVLTLTCPRGTVVRGIGLQDHAQVSTILWSKLGRRSLKVGFTRTANAHYHEANASVYVACAAG